MSAGEEERKWPKGSSLDGLGKRYHLFFAPIIKGTSSVHTNMNECEHMTHSNYGTFFFSLCISVEEIRELIDITSHLGDRSSHRKSVT